MKAFLATLFALFCLFQNVALGQKAAGTWQGKLKDDKDETRLVIKIKEDAGKLSGEIYSIDEDGDRSYREALAKLTALARHPPADAMSRWKPEDCF